MKLFLNYRFRKTAKLICSACLLSCSSMQELKKEAVGPFFGVVPTNQPQLLAPELIASTTEKYNGTFSTGGTEFFYTTDVPENAFITVTRMEQDSSWSEPKVASFSGTYPDYDPIFSPDGSRLYFSSRRPHNDSTLSRIWFVDRDGAEWKEPQHVELTNIDKNEYYNSITNDGTIYFGVWPKLFRGIEASNGYVIEELDSIVNFGYNKSDPFISPKEDYLIFRGYRDDSFGRGDLYITFRDGESWTNPVNLGEPINSVAHETCPYVSADGKLFIFASNRPTKYKRFDNAELKIYYVSADFIEKMRPDSHKE